MKLTYSHHNHRRRKRLVGGGGGGGGGGSTTFSFNFYVKQEKNHKCTKLKGKIIINATLI